MSPSTYASHENGQTPPPPTDKVRQYANVFKASPARILLAEGPMHAQFLVALMLRLSAFAGVLSATSVMAGASPDCRSLSTLDERMKCYDANPGQMPALPPPLHSPPRQNGESVRLEFRHKMETTFLEHGVSMDVIANGTHADILTIFGYLSKATVYQIAFSGRVLESAKEIGFKKVDFDDRGAEGHWIFDLSGTTPPTCDTSRRVCR